MKDTLKKEFWQKILDETDFKIQIEEKYKVAYRSILGEEDEIDG